MPIYDPSHIEYDIHSGFIEVITDAGHKVRAYGASPQFGRRFPGLALIHDWWGLTGAVRRMANHYAQMGYQVIVPDLFDGETAQTPNQAMALVRELNDHSVSACVKAALDALEKHTRSNEHVAAVGIGLGGGAAFEAAITRPDLEAAVAYGGFPQRYFGQFKRANTPILALYGSADALIAPQTIAQLRAELTSSPLKDQHHLEIIDGGGHEFFPEQMDDDQRQRGRLALRLTYTFLERYIARPEMR